MTYVLSAEAEVDLIDIYDYSLAEWGEVQADSYLGGLYDAFENLTHVPKRGRFRRDLGLDVRSILYRAHVIFYAQDGEGVAIVRVLHQSRDLDPALLK